MWQLMRRKKIPPLRKVRYCCEHLKERPVPQQGRAILSLGVRKYESVGRRKKRDELEIASDKKRGDNIIMPFDNSEKRRIFETCYQDNQKMCIRDRPYGQGYAALYGQADGTDAQGAGNTAGAS